MRRLGLAASIWLGCGVPTPCPPGAFIGEWLAIQNDKSQYDILCPRVIDVWLSDFGSVWISATKYRHEAGTATLNAAINSDCDALDVRMTVGFTTRSIVRQDDFYKLQAETVDPWLVAIGVLSERACTAEISHVSVTVP